jgi:CxxC motif-containing protein (DUF1111 family)
MTPYVAMLVGSIASSLLFAAHRSTPIAGAGSARSAASQAQADRFRPRSGMRSERPRGGTPADTPTEAPTGFDDLSNGFDPQGPDYETLNEDNVVALRSFNDNRFIFETFEVVADGLGPTYNAQSCRECHQNVATGGASQVAEHRTGRLELNQFVESLGGSLIQSRAIHPGIMEHVAFEDDVRTFRISTNTLGDGYVEAIANETLMAIRDAQPAAMRGVAVLVPVLEGDGSARIGRFGWKCQHASLESFAADAYLNEMGITSPLLPEENTSAGNYIGFGSGYDDVADPEDDGEDVVAFANFMRATKAPDRGPITADVLAGEQVFRDVGCATCHTPSIVTARAGAVVNGGAFTLPRALGSKIIHPYSDYLLHDVGTGDGIPILPDTAYAFTASQMRTAPLWALRTRNRMMHDGLSFTLREAIQRHGGQASAVTAQFLALDPAQQALLYRFLESL